MPSIRIPPFSKDAQLVQNQQHATQTTPLPVPNEPFLPASSSHIQSYLSKELECLVLDKLAPYLFWVAKRRASHIDALHEYETTRRTITISEDPGLHLVRSAHAMYCKPIPQCLMNYGFWSQYLTPAGKKAGDMFAAEELSVECKSALGLLRTYIYLIKHESDFNVAIKTGLFPDHVTYTRYQYFIEPFRAVPDAAVSRRYEYGHLRLTRLNLIVRALQPRVLGKTYRWTYDPMHEHAGQFVGRFAAPLLFLFASFTLLLSSMQVGLAALPSGGRWDSFTAVSLWFSIAVIFSVIVCALTACLGIAVYVINRVYVNKRVGSHLGRRCPAV